MAEDWEPRGFPSYLWALVRKSGFWFGLISSIIAFGLDWAGTVDFRKWHLAAMVAGGVALGAWQLQREDSNAAHAAGHSTGFEEARLRYEDTAKIPSISISASHAHPYTWRLDERDTGDVPSGEIAVHLRITNEAGEAQITSIRAVPEWVPDDWLWEIEPSDGRAQSPEGQTIQSPYTLKKGEELRCEVSLPFKPRPNAPGFFAQCLGAGLADLHVLVEAHALSDKSAVGKTTIDISVEEAQDLYLARWEKDQRIKLVEVFRRRSRPIPGESGC